MNKFSMINIITLLLINISVLNAEKDYLNIDANHFEGDKQNNVLYFKGDVNMTKNKDILLCQSLVINTQASPDDKTKQIPKDYKATGDVSFILHTVDNVFKGKGDVVYYYPDDKKYIIIGNGYLEDIKEGKKIMAEKIYIDELTGRTKIDGGKDKPIKFRLKLNDKSSKINTNITKETSEKS